MNLDPLSLPIALPDSVDYDEYLIATYLAVFPREIPVRKLAPALAIEQSTGTWVPVPRETPEVKRKHIAKVIGVYEIPDYEFEIPMLLTTIVGNISMGGRIKLLDVRFPEKFVKGFKGPKFGIEGIRKLLNIPKRSLLNNMIKPCTGYTVDVGAEHYRLAALGGCDIVKDDELITVASFNRVEERVKKYKQIEKEVF